MTWASGIHCQKWLLSTFWFFGAPLRARFCAPLGFFTKNPEGNQLLASPKVVRSSRPPSCWRQDTESLTKCWKNIEEMLKKSGVFIVRFQFEWMNVSKSVVNSRTKFSQMAAHVLKIYILVFSVILSNFSIQFLKRFRYRGEKVAPKRSKNWEFLQT